MVLAELHTPRSMASSVCLKNDVYVLGGYDGNMDLSSAEKLDTRVRICVIINVLSLLISYPQNNLCRRENTLSVILL